MFIRKSKTVQYRHGNETLISKGSAAACPVNIHQKVLDLLEDVEEKHFFIFKPIFRSKGICKVSYSAARNNIPVLPIIGLYSLRAGGATVIAHSSVDERCLKAP